MAGDVDRAPIRMSVPQAYLHAGAEAAGAALIAHYERQRSGLGQHVDLSAQQAVTQAMQSFDLAAAVGEQPLQRVTGGIMLGPLLLPLVWEAKDGYVSITFLFGTLGPFARSLMEWVHEEGFCDEATRDKDWNNYAALLMSGEESQEEYQRVLGTIAAFAKTKTKDELLEAALDRRLLIAPITTIAELSGSEQFASRDFWREHSDAKSGREVRYPGPFAKLTGTPLQYRLPAPAIGQHNDDALTREQAAATAGGGNGAASENALEGLKILDLMWVVAGPAATRVFADYGATVVRVESTGRPDTARGLQPFHNGEAGAENSALFGNMNAGKLGLTLDLTKEEGRAVVRDLVRWADVVTESFSPKAMRAWGLDYDSLKEINPKIIMLSSNLFGQTGPLSMFAGFGTMGAAIAGFNSIIGWPDRAPTMVAAYSDYVAPRFMVATVIAALDHRDRTGEGQHIDLAQAEASMHFLSPAMLDYELNGRVQGGEGNNDRDMAPHGIYPASGEQRWVAIAIGTDAHWQALCEEMGRPELASDDRYATAEARLAAREELDAIVGTWTADQEMNAIEAALQERGVPAHTVQNSPELVVDPQLAHRGHFVELEHSVHGTTTVGGSHFRLSRTPARIERSAPTFGRDNFEVLSEILGYDADRIAELAAASVLQ
jgi:crotonobetainyl-CoA:carnitine CoA-transferase CaiB-like acyl-CoA transferase